MASVRDGVGVGREWFMMLGSIQMKKILLAEFGPDANIANIGVTTIFDTEAQRVGLGTGGPLER